MSLLSDVGLAAISPWAAVGKALSGPIKNTFFGKDEMKPGGYSHLPKPPELPGPTQTTTPTSDPGQVFPRRDQPVPTYSAWGGIR